MSELLPRTFISRESSFHQLVDVEPPPDNEANALGGTDEGGDRTSTELNNGTNKMEYEDCRVLLGCFSVGSFSGFGYGIQRNTPLFLTLFAASFAPVSVKTKFIYTLEEAVSLEYSIIPKRFISCTPR